MTGMDVDAVRRIASGLRRHAADIRAIEVRVDAIVGQINGNWQGNRARRFVADWQEHHRSALRLLAERVDGLGQSALNNAAEQENASRGGAGSGSSGSVGVTAGGSPAERGLQIGVGLIAPVAGAVVPHAKRLLKWSARLSGNEFSTGRYTNSWSRLLRFIDGHTVHGHRLVPEDLLRFKRSPVTHFLNQYQDTLKGGQSLVGKVSGVAGIVDSASTSYFEFKSGDVRNGLADGAHGVLNVADATPLGKVPHAWAIKTTASLWVEVGRAATNPDIDYSAKGIGQVLTASPGEWATAIKDSLPDLGKALRRVL